MDSAPHAATVVLPSLTSGPRRVSPPAALPRDSAPADAARRIRLVGVHGRAFIPSLALPAHSVGHDRLRDRQAQQEGRPRRSARLLLAGAVDLLLPPPDVARRLVGDDPPPRREPAQARARVEPAVVSAEIGARRGVARAGRQGRRAGAAALSDPRRGSAQHRRGRDEAERARAFGGAEQRGEQAHRPRRQRALVVARRGRGCAEACVDGFVRIREARRYKWGEASGSQWRSAHRGERCGHHWGGRVRLDVAEASRSVGQALERAQRGRRDGGAPSGAGARWQVLARSVAQTRPLLLLAAGALDAARAYCNGLATRGSGCLEGGPGIPANDQVITAGDEAKAGVTLVREYGLMHMHCCARGSATNSSGSPRAAWPRQCPAACDAESAQVPIGHIWRTSCRPASTDDDERLAVAASKADGRSGSLQGGWVRAYLCVQSHRSAGGAGTLGDAPMAARSFRRPSAPLVARGALDLYACRGDQGAPL
mmetsp:Transcript_34383/g.83629  ORF Transcript_34383/g.83629 Transcript_34383/m.83629 type:complete len:483 (+) Transcript_34383:63-1511(+)